MVSSPRRSLASGPRLFAHPVLDQRPRESPDVDFGIETTTDPLDDDHGFLQQQELRLGFHVELLGDLKELREQAGDRDLLQRSAEDGFADRPACLCEGVERPACRHVPRREMDFRHPAVISGEKTDQHVREVEAGVAIEPPHDAEIDDGDRAIGIDEHVSGVEIGVEKTIAEDLVEKGSGGFTQ